MGSKVKKNRGIYGEILAAALILILGAALRFIWLDSLPMGLNQDEASVGYEAWSLLNYGIDRNGYPWPVLLKSWGSGQNALYSYLSIPFIALFGLNELSVRMTAAVIGTLTLAVFWLIARLCRGRGFALCALFMLAVNPWHIMASRWALESNLMPFFLLAGIYFTSLGQEKRWCLIPAAVSFALSLYSYGAAFIFLPFFLIFAVLWLKSRNAVRNPQFIAALCVFLAMAMPLALCQLRNAAGYDSTSFLGMSLPALTESRQFAVNIFHKGGFSQAADNYRNFLNLLITQSDGLTYNALPFHGLVYIFGLPFAVLGLCYSLGTHRDSPQEMPMLLALAASFISAFCITVNINRLNMAMLPVVYFESLGLYAVLRRMREFAAIPIAVVLFCTMLFLGDYVLQFRAEPSDAYFPGLGQAISYAAAMSPESVFITNQVNQPYIFVLFYDQVPPEEYLSSVAYINPGGAFEHVSSFGKYRFGEAWDASGEILILHKSEVYDRRVISQFGNYAVCYGY